MKRNGKRVAVRRGGHSQRGAHRESRRASGASGDGTAQALCRALHRADELRPPIPSQLAQEPLALKGFFTMGLLDLIDRCR